jgi:hypothetical protein
MHGLLVLWDLSAESKVSFEELRQYLRDESITRFRQMTGLRQKTWISNSDTGKWGALYLFETQEQAQAVIDHLPESRVVELTGLRPSWELFEVEAVVEGQHSGGDLLAAGLALAR